MWIAANFLKLNDDKSELLVGHPKRLAEVTGFELLLGDVKESVTLCQKLKYQFIVPCPSKAGILEFSSPDSRLPLAGYVPCVVRSNALSYHTS